MKTLLIILGIAVVAVIGYFVWMRYAKMKAIDTIFKNHPNTDADRTKLMSMSLAQLQTMEDPNVH